ncbi:MAG: trypsin-like peptidase domain-containing protein [Thermoguttaceae bacterium]
MARTTRYFCCLLLGLAALGVGTAGAQEPAGIEAATAMEKVLVDAIACGEKSVVAIARVRKDEPPRETFRFEVRPDAFGRRFGVLPGPKPTDPSFVPSEYGSGVVVDRRGLILTAYHVLGENSEYYVTTPERKVYAARVIGADPRSDLAVLSIDAAGLVPIALGDATTLRKGQFVITLGNPYAIARDGQATAGWGIVANLARKAPPSPEDSETLGQQTLHHYGTLIQTDAKLNIGASGGPLLNLKGEMVGLCVALTAAAGYETTTGYAIPVDATFRRALDTLKEGREVQYGFLGIQPANLGPNEALSGVHGMRVDGVMPGTPAARFGLKTDDVITDVDQTPLYDADGLVLAVGKQPVESVTRLSILRDGQRRTIDVTLGKYPVQGTKIVTVKPEAWRGMRVDYASTAADPRQPLHSGMAFFDEAVVVSEVAEGTAAWRAGLRPGMFVSQVDGLPVRTPKEFEAAVARKAGTVELRLALDEPDAVRKIAP